MGKGEYMRLRKICLTLLLACGCVCFDASAQDKENPELTKTLAKMDAVSANFKSFTARFVKKHYIALLKEYETPETGEFSHALDKNKDVMIRHETLSPINRIVTIKDGSAVIYTPVAKQAEIRNLGKYKNYVGYLTIGFGQSSAKLREQFVITYEGTEAINGVPCSILTLVPKDAKIASSITSITIWFKQSTGAPTQYKFLDPTGDFQLETFSEEKLNTSIPAGRFEQKFPSGTNVVKY